MQAYDARAWRPQWGLVSRRRSLQWLAAWPITPTTPASATAVQPALQLAAPWPTGRSPQGFLVSEKFDGVRAVWDGQRLRFRSGRAIAAPDGFVRGLPDHPLDGELWLGHGQFDRLSGVVRQQQPDERGWRDVHYLVFDSPGVAGDFESRWQALQPVIEAAAQPWLRRVDQFRVGDVSALRHRLKAVVDAGGEGLVLHRADALWRAGRGEALFKFKPEPDDEALVVGHLPGQGRFLGLTGALRVRTPQGQEFALGSGLTEALRREPPAPGTWVTYRYRDRTPNGVPRFASFVRVRPEE